MYTLYTFVNIVLNLIFHLVLRDDHLVDTDVIFCTWTLVLPLDCLALAVDFGFLGGAAALGAAALVTGVDLVVTDFPLDFLSTGLDLLLVLEWVVAFLGFFALRICELSGVEILFL